MNFSFFAAAVAGGLLLLVGVWLPYAVERYLVRFEALHGIEGRLRLDRLDYGRAHFPGHLWVTPRGAVLNLRRSPAGVAFELRTEVGGKPFARGTTFTARGFLETVDGLTLDHNTGLVARHQGV